MNSPLFDDAPLHILPEDEEGQWPAAADDGATTPVIAINEKEALLVPLHAPAAAAGAH